MLELIIIILVLAFILIITRSNHMWGVKKGVNKAKQDAVKMKHDTIARNRRIKFLKFCVSMADLGLDASKATIHEFDYKLSRVGKPLKYLDRPITGIELYGLMKMGMFVGAFIACIGFTLTLNPFFLIFLGVFFTPAIFRLYADTLITTEDLQIEAEFPDLYLLLYSRLLNGAHTRLAPTLDDYIASLNTMYGDESKMAMKNFVTTFRNNIEVYGDDCIAIKKLRDKYKSSMVVNFCNLAVQALNDVDNSDKLLAFKIELSQKRMEQMTAEAKKRVEKGQRMIWLIFIILAQFVVLSWWAKLGTSFGALGTLFGG